MKRRQTAPVAGASKNAPSERRVPSSHSSSFFPVRYTVLEGFASIRGARAMNPSVRSNRMTRGSSANRPAPNRRLGNCCGNGSTRRPGTWRLRWSVGMGLRPAEFHEKPGLAGETACPTWPELVGRAIPPAFFNPVLGRCPDSQSRPGRPCLWYRRRACPPDDGRCPEWRLLRHG